MCPSEYSKSVDVWSIGCIFAELLGRHPLFPGIIHYLRIGDHYLDQIQKIVSVIGSPSAEDVNFITNIDAKEFVLEKLAKRTKQPFSQLFPKANPVALDLLSKMLIFNPNKRYTIEQCISHPYFELLHSAEDEPISAEPFDWGFDDIELSKDILQSLIYDESLSFHQEEKDKNVNN